MRERHDRKLSTGHNIQIRDKVLVSTRRMLKNRPGLLDPRFVGPFTVRNLFSNSAFAVETPEGTKKTYNITDVKRYYELCRCMA
jgi:hypothetical protein